MEIKEETEQKKVFYRVIIVTGIIVVALIYALLFTSVGPLIGTIRDQLGLSNWSAGMLTSLPLIAFAVMSPLVAKLSNRFTNEQVMLLGLFILFIGITLRSMTIISLLFTGTLLIGLGIAICNVLLPSVIKEKFPMQVALMTSIYSTTMGIFAATASGLSVPIAEGLHLGWQVALIVWAIPALLGIIVWIYLAKQSTDHYRVSYQPIIEQKQIWRSPLAWQVAAFMGFQSFLFYVTISWMPEILQAYGISAAAAGWMLSFLQFIGLPASFIVPVLASKYRSQHGIVLAMGLFSIIGYTGLLLGKSNTVMVVSIILIGFSLSGTFALALTLLGMRARNGKQAAQLSGMAQSFGYVLAAIGPFLVGYLYDKTQTWDIPLLTLISVAIIVVVFGFGAGRDKYVFDE